MRLLISCPTCRRRYDASHRSPGSRFHCHCGEVVVVERVDGHEAAVVRCSSCGGPRQPGAEACGFCGAAFEHDERTRNTICPTCMTRVADGASFCHSCGGELSSESVGVTATELPCPVCGEEHTLDARQMAGEGPPVLECPSCAGLWLEHSKIEALAQAAQEKAAISAVGGTPPRRTMRPQKGPMYRQCPACRRMMNRRNYGRASNVVIDVCKEHGIWFDADELPAILNWIEAGGLRQTAMRDAEDQRRAQAREARRIEVDRTPVGGGLAGGFGDRRRDDWGDDLGELVFDGLGAALRAIGGLFRR